MDWFGSGLRIGCGRRGTSETAECLRLLTARSTGRSRPDPVNASRMNVRNVAGADVQIGWLAAVGHFLPLVTGSFLASHLAMHAPSDALWGCRPMACTRGSEVVDLVRTQAPHGVAIARSQPCPWVPNSRCLPSGDCLLVAGGASSQVRCQPATCCCRQEGAGEHRWTLAEPAAAFQSHFFAADTREVMNAADFSTAVSASGTKSAWNTCHMPS